MPTPTRVEPSIEPRNLVEVLRRWAVAAPQRVALTFLRDGDADGVTRDMTYGELDERARVIASGLRKAGVSAGRVLLFYPPGLEFAAAFFGCAYAGVVAVPVYPPDPSRLDRTLPRLRAILRDADASVVLTTADMLGMRDLLVMQAPELAGAEWLASDQLSSGLATDWRDPRSEPDTLAYLQYTSGSTGMPRGAMVSHRNLVSNLRLIKGCFEITQDVVVIWLPPYHDMGLIGGIVEPVYSGSRVVLFSPLAFLQRPGRWLEAVSRFRGTISGAPNFAYDLCVRKVTPEERRRLDLSAWQLAFCGAELVRPETLDRFVETFGPVGFRREAFYPCYGLAEATLIVSGGRKAHPPVVRRVAASAPEMEIVGDTAAHHRQRLIVGCGTTLPGQRILIVDPHTLAPCAQGQVGEIWVSGPSVARGYWNRPQETQVMFAAHPMGEQEARFLRTGDLGFLSEGELFVTGRLKDLIVIRGRNHSPEDIEATVEQCHAGLWRGACAAFAVDHESEERLVVVQAIEAGSQDTEDILAAIREAVARHHQLRPLAIVLARSSSLAKTSSGKIQRYACRAAFLEGRLQVVAEWRETSGVQSLPDLTAAGRRSIGAVA